MLTKFPLRKANMIRVPKSLWLLGVGLALLCIAHGVSCSVIERSSNRYNHFLNSGNNAAKEMGKSEAVTRPEKSFSLGTTTHILFNNDVDDEFWHEYLGDDFKDAVQVEVDNNNELSEPNYNENSQENEKVASFATSVKPRLASEIKENKETGTTTMKPETTTNSAPDLVNTSDVPEKETISDEHSKIKKSIRSEDSFKLTPKVSQDTEAITTEVVENIKSYAPVQNVNGERTPVFINIPSIISRRFLKHHLDGHLSETRTLHKRDNQNLFKFNKANSINKNTNNMQVKTIGHFF